MLITLFAIHIQHNCNKIECFIPPQNNKNKIKVLTKSRKRYKIVTDTRKKQIK